MFENPRRGGQARNFTTNVPKILDLKLSSEQIFSENWLWVPVNCSDIWHKYHEWYFEIVIYITSGIYAKYHDVKIMLPSCLYYYQQRFCNFHMYRYFKLSWNTTALSQSNCRNFSCRSIIVVRQCCDSQSYNTISFINGFHTNEILSGLTRTQVLQ